MSDTPLIPRHRPPGSRGHLAGILAVSLMVLSAFLLVGPVPMVASAEDVDTGSCGVMIEHLEPGAAFSYPECAVRAQEQLWWAMVTVLLSVPVTARWVFVLLWRDLERRVQEARS